ncbi:MAG: hypothetical protein JRF30_02830 [Deltaproteobacteria bacterium]|nr:hypothetical protein [Deltaproteobacteria bacterium]
MSSRKRHKKRKSRGPRVSTGKSHRKPATDNANAANRGEYQQASVNGPVEINRLICKGKYKAAVNKAKQYHKQRGTEESEAILGDAYVARIREMIVRGHTVDARALMDLVGDTYPSANQRLGEMSDLIAARDGMIDDLVRPLRERGLSRERRTAIEKVIKQELIDLKALARCKALPSDHPLKKGARAVMEAFAAVTSGPIGDETVVLPGIPRRSPMAPWKVLVRAIACFYRRDDEACESCLQAIDPESAPARLVPAIRVMIAEKSNGKLKGSDTSLIAKVNGNKDKFRDSLRTLDRTLTKNNPVRILTAIQNTVNKCEQAYPELLERLKQHISIQAWMNDFPATEISTAMGGPSLKDAYYWRLHARAAEAKGEILWACGLWEEFRKHAIHEGWFSGESQEVAVIYLYMADLLRKLPDHELEGQREDFKRRFNGFHYEKQPPSVPYFLYPERLYRLASEIDPNPETFRQWLEWIEKNGSGWKEADGVAMAWHDALPEDTRPLLHLMESAEKRNALKKALGYLEKAERLNGLNPDVRRARLRLLVATAIRHLKQRKTHLAKNDFKGIEVLPQSCEGDRPAFVAALRCVCALIDKEETEFARWHGELIKLLETELSATVVMKGLLKACSFPENVTILSSLLANSLAGDDLAVAVARGCALGDDMGVPFNIPPKWQKQLTEFFAAQECSLDTMLIRTLADAALRNGNAELAYAASGAGLSRRGRDSTRFLLLRARSLPMWMIDRRNDCISAAIEMARRERDMDLLDEAIELRRGGRDLQFPFSIWGSIIDKSDFSMDAETQDKVLQREKEARGYPSSADYSPDHDYYEDDDDCDDDPDMCKYCDEKDCPDRSAEYVLDDEDDYEDDEFIDLPPNIPPKILPRLLEIALQHGGELPHPEELVEKHPELAEGLLELILEYAEEGGELPDPGGDCFPRTSRASRNTRRKKGRKKSEVL